MAGLNLSILSMARKETEELKWHRGDDYDYAFSIEDDDGDVVPLTGAVVEFMVKVNKGDADSAAVIVKNLDDGVILQTYDDGDSVAVIEGEAIISITNTETLGMTGKSYYYEVVYNVTDGGKRYTLRDGTISMDEQLNVGN